MPVLWGCEDEVVGTTVGSLMVKSENEELKFCRLIIICHCDGVYLFFSNEKRNKQISGEPLKEPIFCAVSKLDEADVGALWPEPTCCS